MTAAGKPKKTIDFKLFYSRAAKVFLAFFVFSFFLLLSSPFWLRKHYRVNLEYSAKEPFLLQTAADGSGNLFSQGKLVIYNYGIPASKGTGKYTVNAFSTEESFSGLYISIQSKGSPVSVKKLSVNGSSGKTFAVDFRQLSPEQKVFPPDVKISDDGSFRMPLDSRAVFRIVMPAGIRAGRDIDWTFFLYAILISLIPSVVLVMRTGINPVYRHIPDILFILCCFLIFLMPVSLIDYTGKVSPENRFFNGFPSLFVNSEPNCAFPAEFEGWLNDRFYGREKLIRRNTDIFGMNWITKIHASSSGMLLENRNAMFGKNKWMFSKFYDTVDMALNKNRFKDEDLKVCAANLKRLETAFRKRYHAPMYIVLPPDKERVYPEFYPEHLLKQKENAESRLEQLYRYLKENTDLKIIYPLPEMLGKKEAYRLYHMTGTHWTNRGAKCAADILLKELKKDFPWIDMESSGTIKWQKAANADVDIARALGYTEPMKQLDADMIVTDEPVLRYKTRRRFIQENLLVGLRLNQWSLDQPEEKKGLRLLAVTDSFWIPMEPFLAPNVRDCLHFFFGFGKDFEISPFAAEIDKYKPDAVVIETTERFLHRFLTIRYGE